MKLTKFELGNIAFALHQASVLKRREALTEKPSRAVELQREATTFNELWMKVAAELKMREDDAKRQKTDRGR